VRKIQEVMESNKTHQLLVYAHDGNL